jgi:hypothetical protein
MVNALVLPDYAELGSLPAFPPRDLTDVRSAHDYFLRHERARATAARRAAATVVLLDRSPLTLIAHEFGVSPLGVPADPAHAIDVYSAAAESGEILAPGAYLYLHVPGQVATARRIQRGPVAAHLTHPAARAGIEQACRRYLATVPPACRLDLNGSAEPADLAASAARLITEGIEIRPVLGWRALAGIAERR